MGLYLQTDSKGNNLGVTHKAKKLIEDGAVEQEVPAYVPWLVCVVNNGAFEAAGFAFSKQEFMEFLHDGTGRPKRWVVAEAAIRANFSPGTIEDYVSGGHNGLR